MESNSKFENTGVFYIKKRGRFSFRAPEEILLGLFKTDKDLPVLTGEIVGVLDRQLPTKKVEYFSASNSARQGELQVKSGYESTGCCGFTNYQQYIELKPNNVPKLTPAKVDEILLGEMKEYHSRCRF